MDQAALPQGGLFSISFFAVSEWVTARSLIYRQTSDYGFLLVFSALAA
jgi:hypothetical protein